MGTQVLTNSALCNDGNVLHKSALSSTVATSHMRQLRTCNMTGMDQDLTFKL